MLLAICQNPRHTRRPLLLRAKGHALLPSNPGQNLTWRPTSHIAQIPMRLLGTLRDLPKKKIQNPYKPSYHPSSPAYNGSLSPYSYDALDYNPTSSKKGTRNPYLQYSPDPHNALDYNPRPSKKVAPNSAKPPTYLPSKPEPCKSSPLSDYSASSQDACIPSLSSPSYLDIGKAPQASAKLGAGTKARSNKPRLQAKQPKKPSQLVQLKKKRQLQRKEQRAKAKAAKKERLEEKRLQKAFLDKAKSLLGQFGDKGMSWFKFQERMACKYPENARESLPHFIFRMYKVQPDGRQPQLRRVDAEGKDSQEGTFIALNKNRNLYVEESD
mmetsp:Transcript_16790/g.46281  ORF Transcript_16790/g.46281 Transcript_16790/m.46281 type:complete len:326 (+) Transcript_16790:115-1092(+)